MSTMMTIHSFNLTFEEASLVNKIDRGQRLYYTTIVFINCLPSHQDTQLPVVIHPGPWTSIKETSTPVSYVESFLLQYKTRTQTNLEKAEKHTS